jgi:hypothetical protein
LQPKNQELILHYGSFVHRYIHCPVRRFYLLLENKIQSNSIRPETVINKYVDPNWRPFIQTPPFPSYISGHSVISAASAEVMTHFFGDNFAYTDTSELEFGVPNRSFKSFRHAADEASWSRCTAAFITGPTWSKALLSAKKSASTLSGGSG